MTYDQTKIRVAEGQDVGSDASLRISLLPNSRRRDDQTVAADPLMLSEDLQKWLNSNELQPPT